MTVLNGLLSECVIAYGGITERCERELNLR